MIARNYSKCIEEAVKRHRSYVRNSSLAGERSFDIYNWHCMLLFSLSRNNIEDAKDYSWKIAPLIEELATICSKWLHNDPTAVVAAEEVYDGTLISATICSRGDQVREIYRCRRRLEIEYERSMGGNLGQSWRPSRSKEDAVYVWIAYILQDPMFLEETLQQRRNFWEDLRRSTEDNARRQRRTSPEEYHAWLQGGQEKYYVGIWLCDDNMVRESVAAERSSAEINDRCRFGSKRVHKVVVEIAELHLRWIELRDIADEGKRTREAKRLLRDYENNIAKQDSSWYRPVPLETIENVYTRLLLISEFNLNPDMSRQLAEHFPHLLSCYPPAAHWVEEAKK